MRGLSVSCWVVDSVLRTDASIQSYTQHKVPPRYLSFNFTGPALFKCAPPLPCAVHPSCLLSQLATMFFLQTCCCFLLPSLTTTCCTP